MQSFIVVAAKPQHRIPSHVLDALRVADSPDLGFVPEGHTFWSDDAGGVAYAGWQASDVMPLGSHWHIGECGLTAFSGRMWPKDHMWRPGEPWAQQLGDYWEGRPRVDADQRFNGIYAAVSLARTGHGYIVTDPYSMAMLYCAEHDDFVAYATAPRLAARVAAPAGTEPDRDVLGAAWLPFFGWIVGDRTGYVGARVLPLGSYVEVDRTYGSRVRFANATPWAGFEGCTNEELVETVHDDLLRTVTSLAELPAEHRIADITGGKDSRIVLALMLEAGVADQFMFRTAGFEHSPDVIAAQAIADRFGLELRVDVPQPMAQVELRRRLAIHVFQTAGMFGAYELKGSRIASKTLKLTGCIGETLRTNYKGYPRLETDAQLRHEFFGRSMVEGSSIVRPEVRAALLSTLDEELTGRVDDGGSAPQDHLDSFYVRQRLRRWFGTYEELGELGRVFPLYSVAGLQAAFAIGPARRKQEWLPFALMRRACPELAKMPFAGSGWSEAVLKDVPDGDDYRVEPVRNEGRPVPWQPDRLLDNRDVVQEYLLDAAPEQLDEIVDPGKVRAIMDGQERARDMEYRQIFGALAAAVWLGHEESTARIGDLGSAAKPAAAGTTAPTETKRSRIRTLLQRQRP